MYFQWPSDIHSVEQRVFVVSRFFFVKYASWKRNADISMQNKSLFKRAVKMTTHREVKYFSQYTFSVRQKQNIGKTAFFF
jgi:hypothetical protein